MQKVAFIHIGKTAGTAIKNMLRDDNRFLLHKHEMTLPALWKENPDIRAFFVVREPVQRFISGFNSRKRKGAPVRNGKWLPEEAEAFQHFETPNDLAEALTSDNEWQRVAARFAMHSIGHVRHPLTTWLRNTEFLEKHQKKIVYVGFLPRLGDELPHLRKTLGLPLSYALPEEDFLAHRAPSTDCTALSPAGRANMERWYADDRPVYDWCLAFRKKMGLRND